MASTGSKMADTQNTNNHSNNSKSDTHELKSVASDVTAKQTTVRSASSGRVTQESREAFLQRRRAKFEQHRKVFEGQQQAESSGVSPRRSHVALLVSSFEHVIRATSQPSVAQKHSTQELANQSATSVERSETICERADSSVSVHTSDDVSRHSCAPNTPLTGE